MKGIENNIVLGVGEISFDEQLKGYYQDVTPSLSHIENGVFASLDEEGIPYCIEKDKKQYYIVTIIQYALICYEYITKDIEAKRYEKSFYACIDWLDKKKETFKDSYVFRSSANKQYGLPDGWISGMYQGQAISLFLRAFQHSGNKSYFDTAQKIFNSFQYDYSEGGFTRYDSAENFWIEEYPGEKPVLVLNGFIYAMLGILDFYRVTRQDNAKVLWDRCVSTLENTLPEYDVWYWSIYDQDKKQLVSYYYQKNVHIPLMEIMYALTAKPVFNKYAIKWARNLHNPLHRAITKLMYRIRPRIQKLKTN